MVRPISSSSARPPARVLARECLVLLAPIACAGLLFGALYVLDHSLRSRDSTFPMVQAMSLEQLARHERFVASVEDKRSGTWTNHENASGTVIGTSRYVMIYLKKRDGSQLCIVEENPTGESSAFLNWLERGRTYEFPTVVSEWRREQSR